MIATNRKLFRAAELTRADQLRQAKAGAEIGDNMTGIGPGAGAENNAEEPKVLVARWGRLNAIRAIFPFSAGVVGLWSALM